MTRGSNGITLQQLGYFIEVAAEGSTSAAADLLYVSQPTMSAAMKDLESRVGRSCSALRARGHGHRGRCGVPRIRPAGDRAGLPPRTALSRAGPRRGAARGLRAALLVRRRRVREDGAIQRCGGVRILPARETRTWDIIEDVRTLRSELGILYRERLQPEGDRQAAARLRARVPTALPRRAAHLHLPGRTRSRLEIGSHSPISPTCRGSPSRSGSVTFYFAEEILSTLSSRQEIRVSDRATIFNLMIGPTGTRSRPESSATTSIPRSPRSRSRSKSPSKSAGSATPRSLTEQAQRYLAELRSVVADSGVTFDRLIRVPSRPLDVFARSPVSFQTNAKGPDRPGLRGGDGGI